MNLLYLAIGVAVVALVIIGIVKKVTKMIMYAVILGLVGAVAYLLLR